MDARLQGRVDASDVLQDGFLDLEKRVEGYLSDPRLPVFLWLRLVVSDRLAARPPPPLGHADAGRRTGGLAVSRSVAPGQLGGAGLDAAGRLTSPSNAAIRAEQILQVQEAINSLDPLDREVVALRHFEQLTRAETAVVLGITEEAGAKRYIRA